MLQIYCPYCKQTREEEEFSYAGEAHIKRPSDPQATSDKEWGDYLFFRKNPFGGDRPQQRPDRRAVRPAE